MTSFEVRLRPFVVRPKATSEANRLLSFAIHHHLHNQATHTKFELDLKQPPLSR